MPKIMLAWIGQADLDAADPRSKRAPGPNAAVVAVRKFDALVLLSDYPAVKTKGYMKWLESRGAPPIHFIKPELGGDPTDYAAIHDAVVEAVKYTGKTFGEDADLAFHVSPGTPSMHAVWVLLAKTRYPAELIQSSPQKGVSTASIPFDISAEYVPDLIRRPDAKLQRLSAGLPPLAPEFSEIIRRSPVMERAVARARKLATRNVRVILEGESGTGKELFARAIHAASPRSGATFEAVNCGALPSELAESLLFGHEKGAFTGAVNRHIGHFEKADGGTLFLDEVGEMALDLQVKLLRVLQESEVRPVGSAKPRRVDVRVIAATNRDLLTEVAEGRFREDLYHRLAVGVVRLPPLRERQGDVGLLVDHLLDGINKEAADQPGFVQKKLSAAAKNLLIQQAWPGNVRQIQNTLLRLSIWSNGDTIGVEDVRDELIELARSAPGDLLGRPLGNGLDINELMSQLVRHYLERSLEESSGNKTRAADLIGLNNYQTFTNWMERHGVSD